MSRMPRVFVTRDLPGGGLERLADVADVDLWPEELPPPRDQIQSRVRDIEGLLCLLTDQIDAELLDAAPQLRAVSTMAVGYDNIDVNAATERNVLVCNTPGVLTETTADLAFALLLAAARRVVEGDRVVREGGWTVWSPSFLLGRDVHGATLGIVGLGAIGRAVARRAKGFGMRVLYTGPTPKPDAEQELGCEFAAFDDLLALSDFVSVHAPLSDATRHMFDKKAFDRMKSNAIFVNTARGGVVDEAALEEVLREGAIAAAAIDVAEVEPMPPDHPLLKLQSFVVAPHVGSATIATRTKMADLAIDNLIAALGGERPAHCVNPQILP